MGFSLLSYLFTFATVRIGVYTAPKYGTEPIRYVTLHFRDRRELLDPPLSPHPVSQDDTIALYGRVFISTQKLSRRVNTDLFHNGGLRIYSLICMTINTFLTSIESKSFFVFGTC